MMIHEVRLGIWLEEINFTVRKQRKTLVNWRLCSLMGVSGMTEAIEEGMGKRKTTAGWVIRCR
ncbi:hypothetical protein TIFTF001_000488 [Ficus carica]|uniref:Uncharacterized protein n=1 Tax=Ficus carica TaxID=3494 RepID=A0AA87Z2A4_FICCA|nr:hypothetical protein TIFTF001_000488 [Ficus carica]